MFEAAELGARVEKDAYDEAVAPLRVDLLNAQFDLREAGFPVVVVVVGDDRAGCNDIVNLLHEWLDARHLETFAFRQPSQQEEERPRFWRYWHALPPKGRIGVYLAGWNAWALLRRLEDGSDDAEFERQLGHIERFERMLAADGAVLLKFWLHLPRKEARKRLEKARKKPEKAWRVDDLDHLLYASLDDLLPLAERLIRRTSTATTPWEIVESTDARHRNLTVMRTLLATLQRRLAEPRPDPSPAETAPAPAPPVLASVDLSARLEYDDYKEKLVELQRELRERVATAREKRVSSVLVFEGWDAAGKGGAIRRITKALDAWDYHVTPVGAPSDEEAAHHYLWRFWRRLPRAGELAVFDRSWYGRVLVERVEGFALEEEWRRAYGEIVDFEEQLLDHGTPVVKFWLHIDPEEQLRRFEAREQTPYKKYKITREDYRNRGRWEDYAAAVDEMVARTSTRAAPWHLVAANDKRWARVEVLRTVCEALERAVKER